MPAEPAVLGDGTRSGTEPLGLTRRLNPLHTPLALPRRWMRVFCTVIEVAMLAMFYPWENLALGRAVALEFIGDEHARHGGYSFQEFVEELLRRSLVTSALHQDIEDGPVLIPRPPQIVMFPCDGEHHFVEVPLVPGPRTAAPQLIGILLAKLAAPRANGFIRPLDATFTEELFHVPEAQTKSDVQPDSVADDLHRKAVILICGEGRQCVHALITS
jgi:hypothetical protein